MLGKSHDEVQLDESKNSIVCEVQTFEEGSCLDIEATIDAVNIESEVRPNLSSETRRTFIKLQKKDETLISVWEQARKRKMPMKCKTIFSCIMTLFVESQSSKLSYLHVKERKFYRWLMKFR
ncbi:hypothetical protein TNIN_47061 [Trichonephila inaurata madagascariensis]|uniref:Uncharacterized protein n=1 Tax=Trichonephila inaurata madagascariensis TaxID=2747483 RepID=A0A8X7CMJ6_9ARAC|nr:hypothetical protein TNIN_47061 [Trichonephila inaurata madagascariensis]